MWNGKEGLNDNIFGVVNDDLVVIGEEMVDGVLGAGEKGGGGEFEPMEEGEEVLMLKIFFLSLRLFGRCKIHIGRCNIPMVSFCFHVALLDFS